MNVIDHTKRHARRALVAARRLLLRFRSPDSHAALAVLAGVRHIALILSRASDQRSLRRAEGRVYAAMQAARAGRSRLPHNGRAFLAEEIFRQMKRVMQATAAAPLYRSACRGSLESLLARTGDLLLLLEHQLTAVSGSGRYRLASAFASLADELRADIAKCRIAVLAAPSETGHHNELTLLQAVGDLADAAGRMAHSDLSRALKRGGKGRASK